MKRPVVGVFLLLVALVILLWAGAFLFVRFDRATTDNAAGLKQAIAADCKSAKEEHIAILKILDLAAAGSKDPRYPAFRRQVGGLLSHSKLCPPR